MTTTTATVPAEAYAAEDRIRRETGLPGRVLLKLALAGRVRHRTVAGCSPRFCLADAVEVARELGYRPKVKGDPQTAA